MARTSGILFEATMEAMTHFPACVRRKFLDDIVAVRMTQIAGDSGDFYIRR
jgi:hypothetical protein